MDAAMRSSMLVASSVQETCGNAQTNKPPLFSCLSLSADGADALLQQLSMRAVARHCPALLMWLTKPHLHTQRLLLDQPRVQVKVQGHCPAGLSRPHVSRRPSVPCPVCSKTAAYLV